MFNLIACLDSKNGIGKDNSIPWKCPEDLKYFKGLTENNIVVMGRKTFDSIDKKPLKNRFNIIISSTLYKEDFTFENLSIVKDFKSALNEIENFKKLNGKSIETFVIGGASIYQYFLSTFKYQIKNIYITRINKNHDCDTFFPIKYINLNYVLRYVGEELTMDNGKIVYLKYEKNSDGHGEYQYLNIANDIINTGDKIIDRTGIGILSKFGIQMRFNLQDGFPLLTTKKVFLRGVIEELLWFLKGSTNSKELEEKNVMIWKDNTSRAFLDSLGLDYEDGDGGPIYGFQMRHFGAKYEGYDKDYTGQGFDQIEYVLNQIKTNPNSRRIVMSLWNPPDLENQCLPPCHVLYQWHVANKKLHCSLYQRSGDFGLGVPFNIASASLLTMIFAKICDLELGDFVHNIGNAHVYKNHIEPLLKQISRDPFPFPIMKIKRRLEKPEQYSIEDFELIGYLSHEPIKMTMAV